VARAHARSGSGSKSGSAACRARRCCRQARTRRTSPPIRVSICSPSGHVADQGSHCESWRSKPACGAVVGTRCPTYAGSSGRLQPGVRTLQSLQRLFGRLASRRSAQLAHPAERGSPASQREDGRGGPLATIHPPATPVTNHPRILNSYDMRWLSIPPSSSLAPAEETRRVDTT
jgi:hypothetical protein